MSSDTGTFSFIGGPGSLRFSQLEESQHRERVFKPDFRPGPRGLAGCLGAGDPGWACCVLPGHHLWAFPSAGPRGEGRGSWSEGVVIRSAECPHSQRRAVGAMPWTRGAWPCPLPSSSVLEAAGHAHARAGPLLAEAMPLPQGPSLASHVGTMDAAQSASVPTRAHREGVQRWRGNRQIRAGSIRTSGIRHSHNSELMTGWKTPFSVPATAREQPESITLLPETTLPTSQAQAELLAPPIILLVNPFSGRPARQQVGRPRPKGGALTRLRGGAALPSPLSWLPPPLQPRSCLGGEG